MGNIEILKRGTLQLTSAGTGTSHSARAHGPTPVHLIQIWSLPHTRHLQPKNFIREFNDEQKTNAWVRVVALVGAEGVSDKKEGEGPAPIHSALTLYATLLEKGKCLEKKLWGKKGYVHVLQTSGYNSGKASGATVRAAGAWTGYGTQDVLLREGDGAYLKVGEGKGADFIVENEGDAIAEVLLFDLE
jgi:quercetin 2,3-dioxygenase